MNSTADETTSDDDWHRAIIGAAIAYVAVNLISAVATDAQLRLIFWLRQRSQGTTEVESAVEVESAPAQRMTSDRHVTSLIHPALRIQIDTAIKAANGKRMVLKFMFNAVGYLHVFFIVVSCFLAAKGYAIGASGCAALLCISVCLLLVIDPSMPRQTRACFVYIMASIGNISSCCAGVSAFVALAPFTPGPAGALKVADHPKLAEFHFMVSLLMGLWTVINFLHSLNTQRVLHVTKLPLSGTIDVLVKGQKWGSGTKFSWDIFSWVRAYYLESARFYAMPIRVACNHFLTAFQIYSVAMGFVTILFVTIIFVQLQYDVPQTAGPEYLLQLEYLTNGLVLGSLLPMGLTFLVVNPLLSSRPVRRYFNHRIAAVGTTSPLARRAIATKFLMGEEDPDVVIERARATFCGIALHELSPAIFTSTSTPAEVYLKTQPLELGTCDAFVSHSWHDDWTNKYNALTTWGAEYAAQSNGEDVVVWWDRACIQVRQESQLSQALSCLPIYVSGCRRMLVLAGPSFSERLCVNQGSNSRPVAKSLSRAHKKERSALAEGTRVRTPCFDRWCAIELFIFSELGGGMSCIDVRPFQTSTSGGSAIADSFDSFEVAKTQCASQLDKDYFISVIQGAFGGEDPFNAIVREILAERCKDTTA